MNIYSHIMTADNCTVADNLVQAILSSPFYISSKLDMFGPANFSVIFYQRKLYLAFLCDNNIEIVIALCR